MGKTTLIKKMRNEAPQGKLAIYRDLEGIHSSLEFAESVFHDVDRYLSTGRRASTKARQLASQLGGTELGGVLKLPQAAGAHWKTLLTQVLEDLAEHRERSVILLWDELPMMLHNIREREGEERAKEMLDTLRSIRQMYSAIRMVFTGSIGLHNVLTALKRTGYANDPTNDMKIVDVPPLAPVDARMLAVQLLDSAGIGADDREKTAERIAAAVDGMPFFIHLIVSSLKEQGKAASCSQIDQMIDSALADPHDPWDFYHYRDRINTYYSEEELPMALQVLDVIAGARTPLVLQDVFHRVGESTGTERLRDLLTQLQRDHYIARDAQGSYRFRFPIIQRWWRFERGL